VGNDSCNFVSTCAAIKYLEIVLTVIGVWALDIGVCALEARLRSLGSP
jgi:hypothetical protein